MIFRDMLDVPGLQQFISRCETEQWGKELQNTLKLLKMDPNAGEKRQNILTILIQVLLVSKLLFNMHQF